MSMLTLAMESVVLLMPLMPPHLFSMLWAAYSPPSGETKVQLTDS